MAVEHIPEDERSRTLGQVFTPAALVEDMLNLLPVWDLPTEQLAAQTFLEPAMGDGNFVVAIIGRLVKRLVADGQCSPEQAFHHVMERQIYGVELDPPIYVECLRRVDDLARSYGTRLVRHHLMQGDGLAFMAHVHGRRSVGAKQLGLHL